MVDRSYRRMYVCRIADRYDRLQIADDSIFIRARELGCSSGGWALDTCLCLSKEMGRWVDGLPLE